jgi:peptidoglycan/xylan/chitin deacetylase (PgdA/CDA1 family)
MKLRHYAAIEQALLGEFGKRAFVPSGDIDRPLTPMELADFAKSNFVEIGNHTYDHAILTLCSPQEVKDQISRCQEALCQLTGYLPRSIAYPNGACSEMVYRVARDLGLSAGFTTRSGSNGVDLLTGDAFSLRRNIVAGYRPPMDQLRVFIYGRPMTSVGNSVKRWLRA